MPKQDCYTLNGDTREQQFGSKCVSEPVSMPAGHFCKLEEFP